MGIERYKYITIIAVAKFGMLVAFRAPKLFRPPRPKISKLLWFAYPAVR